MKSELIQVEITPERVQIGGFGTKYLVSPAASGGAYALLEHTLEPGLLGAPPHRHRSEDELSYVLAGRLTIWRDSAVAEAGPGAVISKPRGEWHTFWNSGSEPVRFLELISPPAFAEYFRQLATLIAEQGPDPSQIGALAGRYGLEFDFVTIAPLLERHNLRLG